MNSMKRIICLFLVLFFLFSVACSRNDCSDSLLPEESNSLIENDHAKQQKKPTNDSDLYVPDLMNTDCEAGRSVLLSLSLVPIIEQQYSDSIPNGYVISTNPAAGTKTTPGERVVMFVSAGPSSFFASNYNYSWKDEFSTYTHALVTVSQVKYDSGSLWIQYKVAVTAYKSTAYSIVNYGNNSIADVNFRATIGGIAYSVNAYGDSTTQFVPQPLEGQNEIYHDLTLEIPNVTSLPTEIRIDSDFRIQEKGVNVSRIIDYTHDSPFSLYITGINW